MHWTNGHWWNKPYGIRVPGTIVIRDSSRKLTDLQIICKYVSFLFDLRNITSNRDIASVLLKKPVKSSSVKRRMSLLGNINLLHSVKFRFTFTHVYIHALLNLKIKPSSILILVYYTLLYISISKLKLKLMALNSIHFSFCRN